ncbi:MAG: VWA domain-containing protein [Thermonemataceae bacterium]
MLGYRFTDYQPEEQSQQGANFESLLKVFLELINMTGGDVGEALAWLNNLDRKYNLTDDSYGIGDFIEDLKRKGYIEEKEGEGTGLEITAKSERTIRRNALEDIFGKLKRSRSGNHKTNFSGLGDERGTDRRDFQFGDELDKISITDSLRNAQINHGFEDFIMTQDDLEVIETEYKAQTSTVLMIDISHSMILYGEDRITPAKKVAMALAELIMTKYPKDTLDIIVFGNDAWQIKLKDLPYLQVGPYHTNTVAGVELAMDILRRRKNQNKQIFMITDGKPTCIKQGIRYYKNSFGLDKKILNKTLNLARQCRRLKIPITTFMIATDPYLQEFVREFTQVNNGRAYYSSLKGLGNYIFEDYQRNRKKNI